MRPVILLAALVAVVELDPRGLMAQDVVLAGEVHGTPLPRWMEERLAADPTAFEFRRALRRPLLLAKAQRQFVLMSEGIQSESLGPQMAASLGTAVTGTLDLPVVPLLFQNSGARPYSSSRLQQRLFGAGGGSLTLRDYYLAESRGLFSIAGVVANWTRVPGDDTAYEGAENGRPPGLGNLLKAALDQVDRSFDFARFDRDRDGFVDVVAFVQPKNGGECGQGATSIWSQRWTYGSAIGRPGEAYQTNDNVKVYDFIIQPALECDMQTPVQIGVFAHELGHAIGLPDLYSTTRVPRNAGIGVWGLMSSGGWNRPDSPASLEAWSRAELGWVPVHQLVRDSLGLLLLPIASKGDILRLQPDLDRGEYFLLENRQRIGTDRHLPGVGLLLWHVDSVTIDDRLLNNTVQNTTSRKGLDLVEADGGQLDLPNGRSDAGDPYPGTSAVHQIDGASDPRLRLYSGGSLGVRLGNIHQVGDGIVLDVQFRSPMVAAADPVGGDPQAMQGPSAVIRFADSLSAADLDWLGKEGFAIDRIFRSNASVLVRLPGAYDKNPLMINDRILHFEVQRIGRDP